jgi:hypothetical protein
MPLTALPVPVPGLYPGGGKASLLRANAQQYLFQQQLVTSGQASIAVQLERIKSAGFYPFGVSMQIWFTDASGNAANPGTFEVDLQRSDVDADAQYSVSVGVTALNTSFSTFIELPWLWAKFVRAYAKTVTNAVYLNVLVTR